MLIGGGFMLFLFIFVITIMVGAVPVMVISLGSKSSKNNFSNRVGSVDKILQLERRVAELEKELNGSVRRRIENIETIVTEDEYSRSLGRMNIESNFGESSSDQPPLIDDKSNDFDDSISPNSDFV